MKSDAINEETHLQLMRLLEQSPDLSQRGLSKAMGVSLGKVNYCLKALAEVGWIKAGNFARSKNKAGYAYVLTPSGVKNKAQLTARFLERKQQQYELLKREIELLKKEIGSEE